MWLLAYSHTKRQSPKLYKALDVVTPEWPQPTAEQLSQQHLSTEGAASVHSTTPATPATNPITDAAAVRQIDDLFTSFLVNSRTLMGCAGVPPQYPFGSVTKRPHLC